MHIVDTTENSMGLKKKRVQGSNCPQLKGSLTSVINQLCNKLKYMSTI